MRNLCLSTQRKKENGPQEAQECKENPKEERAEKGNPLILCMNTSLGLTTMLYMCGRNQRYIAKVLRTVLTLEPESKTEFAVRT